jgi:hypothetical protein
MYNINGSDYKDVPKYLLVMLNDYARNRIPLGHFLTAVLEDRLGETVARADLDNIRCIRGIVMFVYNELPNGCHGSPDKVKAWLVGEDTDMSTARAVTL